MPAKLATIVLYGLALKDDFGRTSLGRWTWLVRRLFLIVLLIVSGIASYGLPLGAQPAHAPNRPVGDKWALVVGISSFADSSINLRFAAKDASDFASFLVKDMNFAPDHVKLLLNEQATRQQIMELLGDKWLPRVAEPDDLVVIFISTHGSPSGIDVAGMNYIVAFDTNKDSLYATGINIQELAQTIKSRVHSDRVVVILDACHSGAAQTAEKGITRSQSNFSLAELQGTGQLVICSSDSNQVSWEGKTYENGVFTKHLIDSLKQQGASTRLGSALASMKEKVQTEVLRDRGELQTPQVKSKWEGSDLILGCRAVRPRQGLNIASIAAPARAAPGGGGMSQFAPGGAASQTVPGSGAGSSALPGGGVTPYAVPGAHAAPSSNVTTHYVGATTAQPQAMGHLQLTPKIAVLPIAPPEKVELDEIWDGLDKKGEIRVRSSSAVAALGENLRALVLARLHQEKNLTDPHAFDPAEPIARHGGNAPEFWVNIGRQSGALYLVEIDITQVAVKNSYVSDEVIMKVSARLISGENGDVLWQIKDRRYSYCPMMQQDEAILSTFKNFLAHQAAKDLGRELARAVKGK